MEFCAKKLGIQGAKLTRLLHAKNYREALDFIFLCFDTLIILEMKLFLEYLNNENKSQELEVCISKIRNLDWDDKDKRKAVLEEAISSVKNFSADFFNFTKLLSERSENFKLINSFIWEDCASLLQLLLLPPNVARIMVIKT